MGKKAGKKDSIAKKEEKKKRQEGKASKSAKKKAGKEAKEAGEEDIDAILAEIMAKEAQKTAITVSACPQPSPRANFTMTTLPSGDMLLFGGEYYDGDRNECFNELFRWTVETNNWRRIDSPNTPPPRCSHQAVLYRDHLYIFGGEFATAEQFYHYRDFWRLDCKTNGWESLELKGKAPSARSGHRMVVWRNFLVLFGGFYEAYRDTNWYGDLYLMNFQDLVWQKIEFPATTMVPAPRSGCQLAVHIATDTVFIYGGYSKIKNPGTKSEAKVHSDMWALHLKPVAAGGKPTIEKVSRKGKYPSARSGAAMTVHKNKAILFGGVWDKEGPRHTLESEFFNELYTFDMDRKVWYHLKLKAKRKMGEKRRRKVAKNKDENCAESFEEDFELSESDSENEEEIEVVEEDENNGQYKENAFGYIDQTGKMIYIEDEEHVDENLEEKVTDCLSSTKESPEDGDTSISIDEIQLKVSVVPCCVPAEEMKQEGNSQDHLEENHSEAPVPLPRINPCLVMKGARLYIYGGITEIGDREVTLDDFWSLDLNQREQWSCIAEGTMHLQVWKGEDTETTDGDDDEEDGDSNEDYAESDEDNDDLDEVIGELTIQEDEDLETKEIPKNHEKTPQSIKKEKVKPKKKKGLREELMELHEQLDLSNVLNTPQSGETLRDFYARTAEYWTHELIHQARERASLKNIENGIEHDSELLPLPDQTLKDDAVLTSGSQPHRNKTIDWEEVLKMREKELRKTAFILAENRFEELKPVLERLNLLEQEQRAEEEAETKKNKHNNKSRR